MKVLLLDDSVKHRRAGKRQLEALGHEVVAFSDYTEACERAKSDSFDVALIDLLMPAEGMMLGANALKEHLGKEIGVGFPMLLILSKLGISKIAVATDANHHNHPMSALVDWFERTSMHVNGAHVLVMHAPMHEDGTKNWGEVLNQLVE